MNVISAYTVQKGGSVDLPPPVNAHQREEEQKPSKRQKTVGQGFSG